MTKVSYRVRFMLDHRWAPGHMSDYVDDELSVGARTRLERHCRECRECRGLLRSLRRMLTLLHQLPSSPHVPDVATAVRRRLGEPPDR
jgi:anti-sigma factor RsiW